METRQIQTGVRARLSLPVVCIGMSAGSIRPLRVLFRQLGSNTGMAFVIIHHLRKAPTHLPEIIGACTTMPVELAEGGSVVRPNRIYILPPGGQMNLADGHFSIRPMDKVHGYSNVLTLFVESLAKSRHPGIAVILSGLDGDGAAALAAFKEHGGVTIVQEPGTAESPSMPEAALKTGCVDYSLPPAAIASKLEKLALDLRSHVS